MNFKLFFESHSIKPFVKAHLEDFTDPSIIAIMADKLEEEGEQDLADVLHLSYYYFSEPHDQKLTDQLLEKMQKIRSELFNQHHIVVDYQGVQNLTTGEKYNTYGSSIRYINTNGKISTLDIDSIEDPIILRAVALNLANILFNASGQTIGLPNQFPKYRSKKWYEKQSQYLSNKNEKVLRTYLFDFLRSFTLLEEIVSKRRIDFILLQRRLNQTHDVEAIINTIKNYKYQSNFLKELKQRINKFISRVSELNYYGPFIDDLLTISAEL